MPGHGTDDWNALARRFDERVCHVLAEDRGGVVAKALSAEARRLHARGRTRGDPRRSRRSHSQRRILAGDFGCGTGRALRLLLRHFGSVIATDASESCLAVACAAARGSDEVTFVHADLGAPRLSLPVVDVGLCVNVAIMPDERVRRRLLANVARHVRPGGRLLLVVPALESQLLVRRRWTEWTRSRWRTRRDERPVEGLFQVGGALTKHWTREELLSLAPALRCRAISVERVEYGWETEFERPARNMRDPYPWDWLAVLERRR